MQTSIHQHSDGELDWRVNERLQEFVDENNFALHASIFYYNGRLLAEASGRHGVQEGVLNFRTTIEDLLRTYPRRGLQKAWFDDELGSIVFNRLDEDHSLVVVANNKASMGSVSVAVNKFASNLDLRR